MILTLTVTGGTCPGTYSAEWLAETSEWFSNDLPETFRLTCGEAEGGGCTWYLSMDQSTIVIPVSSSCDPFEVVFDIENGFVCGDYRITITG
jgi:hypothetical protein